MSKMLHAGDFRHLIELQALSTAAGATGEPEKIYDTYDTVRAKFTTDRGSERLAAQQVNAVLTAELLIYYRNGVLPTDRVKFGDRILDIKSVVDVDEAHRWLRLTCTEAV